jgi:hypothetical protein
LRISAWHLALSVGRSAENTVVNLPTVAVRLPTQSERFCTALGKQVGESIGWPGKGELAQHPDSILAPVKGKT